MDARERRRSLLGPERCMGARNARKDIVDCVFDALGEVVKLRMVIKSRIDLPADEEFASVGT